MAFCTDCGFKLPDSAAFCPNCGRKLSETDGAAVAGAAEGTADGSTESLSAPTYYQRPEGAYSPENYQSSGYDYAGVNKNSDYYNKNSGGGGSKTAIIVIVSVLLLLVVAVVLIFKFAASTKDSSEPGSQQAPSAAPTTEAAPESVPPAKKNTVAGSGYVDGERFFISFIGAEQFTDLDNEPAIRIYYEFTNYFEYPQSAWYTLDWIATQDGKQLEDAYSWEDDEAYYYDTLNIRSGLTIQCYMQFKYNPAGGKVDLSVYGLESGEEGGKVSCTYIPGSLPGAPAAYEFQIFSEPQWTVQLASEGYLDGEDYYASVIDAELIDDYDNRPAIRVYYEFTNLTQYPVCLYDALYIFTYQDGVELLRTYASTDSLTDDNLYVEVGSGETITASYILLLRNESSHVEAELEGSRSYDAIGHTFRIN